MSSCYSFQRLNYNGADQTVHSLVCAFVVRMQEINILAHRITGIIPFSDCGEFEASLVSGVVSFMVEGRVGFVKG